MSPNIMIIAVVRSCTPVFLGKVTYHIHDVIYRPHFSRGTRNESFQLTPCRETFI